MLYNTIKVARDWVVLSLEYKFYVSEYMNVRNKNMNETYYKYCIHKKCILASW